MMTEYPKFSVLMSVYIKERPEYLQASLNSLVKQTVLPSEIVLVEDGPLSDELNQVVEKFDEAYPKLFRIKKLSKNKGLGKALNIGLLACENELVARMDSDDIAVENRFAIQLTTMIREDLDIYGGQIIEFTNDIKNTLAKRIVPLQNNKIIKFAHKRNPFNHMTVMFKKSKIQMLGSYRTKPGYEDYDLWVRAIIAGLKLKNDPGILVYVRAGEDMVNRRGGIDYIKSIIGMRMNFFKLGFYTKYDLFVTISTSTLSAILPTKIRYLFYYKVLRK
ncbi:glycosyltransferase [Levilactobacillus brevis]|uniref:glycosyltransferase n=2 Tax=Levilactobacillus brevis TaxID=1580 RepID=UPI001C1EEB21|nr:glycosyltransferase [Levilactobacillus brevis]MBU7560098.1 glycosyltransferase [Levilactobacillus brevis]MCE6026238.1 glycosyltransferase [Levilactobacillus brevis]